MTNLMDLSLKIYAGKQQKGGRDKNTPALGLPHHLVPFPFSAITFKRDSSPGNSRESVVILITKKFYSQKSEAISIKFPSGSENMADLIFHGSFRGS